MTAVFERILEMSGMASVVIVVVLLIRLCLRKAPRKYSYALWSVAAFRLVCPVSFKAFFSLFTFAKRIEEFPVEQPAVSPAPVVSPGYFDSVPPGYTPSVDVDFDPDYAFTYPLNTPPAAETPAAAPIDWLQVAAIVWLIGLAALLIYGVVSYVRLRRRMDTAVLAGENVWHSDRVQSPFILGFVRPKIYLPFGLSADQQRYVLAHERYHLKRFDHIVRPLSFLILAVHWFNPFAWLAYYLMSRDMEMSCDEKVLSAGDNIRRAYSTTLLSFAANRRFPAPSPLAFGESGVKGRIKNTLNWKKPRTWVTVIAVIVCIVVIIVCAANPKETVKETVYEIISTVTAEDLNAAVLGGDEMDASKLTESERIRLAELLNRVQPDELGREDVEDISPSSGQLRVSFPWGALVWEDGQLYIGWIDGEGGSVNAYRFLAVNNDELTAYVVHTLGGLREPLPDYTNPDDWARAIKPKHVDWAELMINGENPLYRSLTDSEIEGLLLLLNNGGVTFSAPSENGAWAFPTERMITLCCSGVEYVLNLGTDPMTIICKDGRVDWEGENTWFVDSDSLKYFIRQLPVQPQVDDDALAGCTPYVSVKCVYQLPTISAIMPDDSGKNYLIGENLVAILDKKDNDDVAYFLDLPPWQELTLDEWNELFWAGFEPDISGYRERRIRWLSEECALADLDGTLWILLLPIPDGGAGGEVFFAYELASVNADTPTEPDAGYYQSVECVFLTPISSALATADSGYYYLLQGDELRLVNKHTGAAYSYTADGNWQELSEEVLHKMEWGTVTIGGTDLWDTLRERQPMIRLYGNDSGGGNAKFLLNFGDELWVGDYGYDSNGYIHIVSVYRLERLDGSFSLPTERLAVWQADLTHDGVDETLTLTYQEELGLYTLTVTTSTGEAIWTGEASIYHSGNNGIYLYERDGKHYLMQWNPYGNTGGFDYHYEVFSLTEEGEEVLLASNSMEFFVMNEETLLQLDIGALRAFEQEVNSLLEDTILLISTLEGYTDYGTETEILRKLWTSMADTWEQGQQELLNSMERLAVWQADLTHDGAKETVTLSQTVVDDSVIDFLTVTAADGRTLWMKAVNHVYEQFGYYLYEKGGKSYLLQWTPYDAQGYYSYSYRVFSLSQDGQTVTLEEDSLRYDLNAGNYRENILTVDTDALRAFEKKINTILSDSQVLLVGDERRVLVGDPREPVSDSWTSPADEWERERQYQIDQLPLVWIGWEGDPNLVSCVEEQVKLRMGDYELVNVDVPERITTAAIGTTGGSFIYRVTYRAADYNAKKHQLTWQDSECFYIITHEIWGESVGSEDDEWNFVGTLTEEELQSRFNTPEMLARYDNDLYLAAVVEMNMWERLLAINNGEVVGALKKAGVDLSKVQILSTERIDCDAGGTSRGIYIYQLRYLPAGKREPQTCYIVMDLVLYDLYAGQTAQHTLLGILSEAELQQYNREEILKQYDNDLYRAAALETYRKYHED